METATALPAENSLGFSASDHLNLIGQNNVSATYDGTGFSVAILDTGIDTDHDLFAGKIAYSGNFSTSGSTAEDIAGHGTHVAGLAAGLNVGVAQGADLLVLDVFEDISSGPSAYQADIEKALKWCIRNADKYNITAVNMSLGRQ